MGKSHITLIKETKGYKRKIHPLPMLIGIVGNIIEISSFVPDNHMQWVLFLFGITGIIASVFSFVFPIICGIVLIILSFIFASVFLDTIFILGLIGAFLVFLSGFLSVRLRKDLLSKWGW